MNIGLVNSNPAWGGGEQWFWDASRALAEHGHQLVLVSREGTRLFELFRNSGYPTFTMKRLHEALVRPELEVVICNSGKDLRRAIKSAPKPMGFRAVLRRGIDRPLHDNPFRRRYWRELSAILVNSDATGHTIRRSLPWFPEERIHRIYNPVSLDVEHRLEPDTPHFRLGVVGRLVKQKGIKYLIKALSKLRGEINWTLEIAGNGKLRKRLESLVDRLGLGERCQFLGHIDALPSFYARMDAIIIPSLFEGFCFVAVEAALAGLPVVASDTSSLTELVVDGETGILVPPCDVDALATAIKRLAEDREMAAAYGAAARRRASECFNPARLHDELNDFLVAVFEKPPVCEI